MIEFTNTMESVLDYPVPNVAPFLLAAFPEAKMVFSCRDYKTWKISRCYGHRRNSHPMMEFLGGKWMDICKLESLIGWQLYTSHTLLISSLGDKDSQMISDIFERKIYWCENAEKRFRSFAPALFEIERHGPSRLFPINNHLGFEFCSNWTAIREEELKKQQIPQTHQQHQQQLQQEQEQEQQQHQQQEQEQHQLFQHLQQLQEQLQLQQQNNHES
uniref:Uncharacterized protein n=1 Tax=Paramoeba aestuarina TaxID=180227 RepID=A0A7S4L7D5_9EUKA